MSANPTDNTNTAVWIPIGRILPNPHNPRGEITPESVADLVDSIRTHGIKQNLLITPYRAAYYCVIGHRRHLAAKLAGLTQVPCVVENLTFDQQMELMLVENIQRQNLSPLQEARGFKNLIDAGCSYAEIARRVQVTPERIRTRLELMQLEPSVAQRFDRRDLPLKLISLLAEVGHDEQKRLVSSVLARRTTASDLERHIKGQRNGGGAATTRTPTSSATRTRENSDSIQLSGSVAAITRTEAIALLKEQEFIASETMIVSLAEACDGCDEKNFPQICRECPLTRFIARIVEKEKEVTVQ